MRRERDEPGGSRVLGLVLLALLVLVCAAAAPAHGAAARIITITIRAKGNATWSTDGAADKGQLALRYRWRGQLTFSIPARVLVAPTRARFAASATTLLRASWTGELSGTRFSAPYAGTYKCAYAGVNVPRRVNATLTNGDVAGTLWLVLRPRGEGFFPAKGQGATTSCITPIGRRGPTHFQPAWLFRDSLQDHGRFTANTAVISVSTALLHRSQASVTFPNEVGSVDQPLRAKLTWNNQGLVTLHASKR